QAQARARRARAPAAPPAARAARGASGWQVVSSWRWSWSWVGACAGSRTMPRSAPAGKPRRARQAGAGSRRAAVAALPGSVPLAQRGQIGIHVAAGAERRPEADDLVGVMEVRRQDRHLRIVRDLPEAGLPALHALAGALRGQRVPDALAAPDQLHRLPDRTLRRTAVDRDHPQ